MSVELNILEEREREAKLKIEVTRNEVLSIIIISKWEFEVGTLVLRKLLQFGPN